MPEELLGARVLVVRTAAGDADEGSRHGLPNTGLWLVPELAGLLTTPAEEDET
jgi:hypothetical protein